MTLNHVINLLLFLKELWISEGRPRQGPTYQERLRVRDAYKNSIRAAKKAPKRAAWNRLHSAMESQDTDSFWKWWRSIDMAKKKSHFAPVVDGHFTKEGIASEFQVSFQKNSQPNNPVRVDELNSQFNRRYAKFAVNHADNCNCAQDCVTLALMIDAICCMTLGKKPR